MKLGGTSGWHHWVGEERQLPFIVVNWLLVFHQIISYPKIGFHNNQTDRELEIVYLSSDACICSVMRMLMTHCSQSVLCMMVQSMFEPIFPICIINIWVQYNKCFERCWDNLSVQNSANPRWVQMGLRSLSIKLWHFPKCWKLRLSTDNKYDSFPNADDHFPNANSRWYQIYS